jgi:predicted RNase H-like HicB family nuclease
VIKYEKRRRVAMKYIVLIHKEDNRYWGECPELPGCFSQGDTTEELMENMKEAAALYLDGINNEEQLPSVFEVRELAI